jgi:RNA polymerase sigma-70 factor (ECF subfamily)
MAPNPSTCWTLVRGAAAGNADDREAFCARYGPVVRAYLAARWRLPPDHEEVADAAQEVFLQCLKREGALESVDPARPGGFRAYFYGIARNVAADLERKSSRRRERQIPSEVPDREPESREASLSRVFDRAWARMVTREARSLMAARAGQGGTAAQRLRALELRYQEGLPARDIAARLGIAAEAAYQVLHKARREFRTALLEVMASYHPRDSREDLEQRCAALLAGM